jgi:hypothetical protein
LIRLIAEKKLPVELADLAPIRLPPFQFSNIPLPPFCSAHELSTYYPLDSRVKPLQLSNFESQVLFLLSTTPVYRMMNAKRKTKNGKTDNELHRCCANDDVKKA